MEQIMSAIADGVIGPEANTMKKKIMRRKMKMSDTIDRYIIERLERTERNLEYAKQRSNDLIKELKETQEKLSKLANMFEKTESEDGKYTWYKVKGNFLISSEKEAYKIIDDQLEAEKEIEMPF